MKTKHFFLFFSFLLFLPQAFAVDAKVIFTKGNVIKVDYALNEEGKGTALKVGDHLLEGYEVITAEHGMAILKIDGHSNIRIEPNTRVRLEQLPYFYEGSDKEIEQGSSFFLKFGTMVIDLVKSFGTEAATVRTKNSVLGVRGTKFLVNNDKNENDVLLTVNTGLVEIKNADKVDFVGKGESIVVEKDRFFTKKQKYNVNALIDWSVLSKKPKRIYASLNKSFRNEFKKRKQKWTYDKKRIKKQQRMWNVKRNNTLERVRKNKLKRSPILQQRKKRIKAIQAYKLQELKQKKRKQVKRKRRKPAPGTRNKSNATRGGEHLPDKMTPNQRKRIQDIQRQRDVRRRSRMR